MPPLTWREFLLWILRRRRRFRVLDRSMLPTLPPGVEVLVDPRATPRAGDVVVARHPREALIIVKRVHGLSADGRLMLQGDNAAASSDSRAFGPVARDAVLGVVTCLFAPGLG